MIAIYTYLVNPDFERSFYKCSPCSIIINFTMFWFPCRPERNHLFINIKKSNSFDLQCNSPPFAAVYFDATRRNIHRWLKFTPRRGHSVACIVWALSVGSELFLDPRQTKECVLYMYTKEKVHRLSYTVLLLSWTSNKKEDNQWSRKIEMHLITTCYM